MMKTFISYKGLVIIWLCLPLFARGLYFIQDVGLLLFVGLFLLFWRWKQEKRLIIPKDWLLFFLLFYLSLQCLGYGFFLERGMLFEAITRSLFYLISYLLLVQISSTSTMIMFKWLFSLSVGLGGLVSSVIYVIGEKTPLNYVIDQRLAGPLQYANTNAVVSLLALLVFIQLKMKVRYKISGTVILTVPLILSMSRATLFIGLVVVIISQISAYKNKDWWTPIALILGVVLGISLLQWHHASEIIDRIEVLNFHASEWQTRLLYYKDAWTMLKERWTGYGPYGYFYAQKVFQTGSLYHVKYVHSSWLQAFLDMGVLGGILVGMFMFYSVVIRRYPWQQRWAVIALLGHSLIDVDLQFAYIWVLLFVFLMKEAKQESWQLLWKERYTGVFLSMGGFSIWVMMVGMLYTSGHYEQTLSIYPYHTESLRKVMKKVPLEKRNKERARQLIERNGSILESYQVLLAQARKEKETTLMVDYAAACVAHNPLNIERYEIYEAVMFQAAEIAWKRNQQIEAKIYLEKIVKLPEELRVLAKEKNTDYNVKHKPKLEMTPSMWATDQKAIKWLEKIKYIGN